MMESRGIRYEDLGGSELEGKLKKRLFEIAESDETSLIIGGLKEVPFKTKKEKDPEGIVINAVYGMFLKTDLEDK